MSAKTDFGYLQSLPTAFSEKRKIRKKNEKRKISVFTQNVVYKPFCQLLLCVLNRNIKNKQMLSETIKTEVNRWW